MAWCESGYNLMEASKALYIHRINKIEALVGESPRDYVHAFALYLACLLDSIDPR
jgi:carbohydrate diacid regulator